MIQTLVGVWFACWGHVSGPSASGSRGHGSGASGGSSERLPTYVSPLASSNDCLQLQVLQRHK